MAVHHQLINFGVSLWQALRERSSARRASRRRAIVDRAGLREFLQVQANIVSQSSLYGYLRTRAGTRFPELFESDAFCVSINVAKWHVWLACLSDLAVHAGRLLARQAGVPGAEAGRLVQELVEAILASVGEPEEAGGDYAAHAARVRARLALCDWHAIDDGEAAFTESPGALVEWAPIVDDLKRLDEAIVRNSVRFRWQEVRRDLREDLDAGAVMKSEA